jgi:tetratricopeptide (TPR) repeat protein
MAVARADNVSVWVWISLSVLILLALAVIFVLPRVVQQYELPLVKRAEPAVVATPVATNASPSSPAISPFEEAQRSRQRREAQDVLASLLRRQAELDAASVQLWAPQAYAIALDAARRGDEFYRAGEFGAATVDYEESDMALANLLEEMSVIFAVALEQGELALTAGDSARALEQFTLAIAIDPPSADANEGLQRAQTLDQVEALLAEAVRAQTQGDLQRAQALLRQAADLDPAHGRAAALVADNRQRIINADFTGVMSEGFVLLEQGRAQEAIAAFERALRVRPGNAEANAAIGQAREMITLEAIAAHRVDAEAFEVSEQWQNAMDAYDKALALDPNVTFAVEGRDYSERRLQLDNLFELNINQPERLSDQAAYDEALEVLRIGRDLSRDLDSDLGGAGPRLTTQLQSLESVLEEMQTPLEVRLISDNATHVTIYQVGQLGTFTETMLMLRPGRYVAVGTRPGYRDVREEFVVGFGRELNTLTINCNEQIAAVNRR